MPFMLSIYWLSSDLKLVADLRFLASESSAMSDYIISLDAMHWQEQLLSIDTMTPILPPGLHGALTEISSGGNSEWMPFDKKKLYTNAFIVQTEKVLLGYKKRGFGKHMYNGFGGKVDPGETSKEAAIRELQEEAGIVAPLEHCGILLFVNEGAEWAFHIDMYRAEEYTGVPTETEEMRPEWFALPPKHCALTIDGTVQSIEQNLPPIPYEKMWEDDYIWLPLLLSKKRFSGRVDFRPDGERFEMLKWWFGTREEDIGSL